MKYFNLVLILFFILVSTKELKSQPKTQEMVEYNKNFVFKNGIYMSFEEFKNNNPSIKNFKVINNSIFSQQVSLEYQCIDKKGEENTCLLDYCWGFVQKNNLYIFQGLRGYYYRIHIIGALIHYFAIETMRSNYDDYVYGYPSQRIILSKKDMEYVIDFKTGDRIEFNYKNFSRFLKTNDDELFLELKNSKRKRKMIYHFMLKYNEKHPIYLPLN